MTSYLNNTDLPRLLVTCLPVLIQSADLSQMNWFQKIVNWSLVNGHQLLISPDSWLTGHQLVNFPNRLVPYWLGRLVVIDWWVNCPLVTAPYSLIGRSQHVSWEEGTVYPGRGAQCILGGGHSVSFQGTILESEYCSPVTLEGIPLEYYLTVSLERQYPPRSVERLYWHSDVSQHLDIHHGLPHHAQNIIPSHPSYSSSCSVGQLMLGNTGTAGGQLPQIWGKPSHRWEGPTESKSGELVGFVC